MNFADRIRRLKNIAGKIEPFIKTVIGSFAFIFLLIIALFIYDYVKFSKISEQITSLHSDIASLSLNLASTTSDLNSRIDNTHSSLSTALNEEKQNVGNIQQTLGNFQAQVGNISGTVNTLQKLSKTDKELLEKYSKVFFLNEYYAPARLAEVPGDYKYSDKRPIKVMTEVWPYLKNLLDGAARDNVKIYVFSGYRSFSEQQALKGQYTVTYGAGTANQFSADQGYSEHQLGTTVDLITTGLGGQLDGFDATNAYNWLQANAYKYGFILSYPKNNKFYVFEPWHWRFVGIKLATDLHNQGKNFYDMDQRDIDEYLVHFFD